MLYTIDKDVILESVNLLEEEMSQMAKNGMKVGALGATAGLAHAGTFGTGIKNMVDGAGGAIAGGAQTAAHHVGNSLTDAGKFYGHQDTPENANSHQVQVNNQTHHDATKVAEHSDNGDDDSGMGILGAIGAGTVAAGLGYAGLKGAKAGNKAYQGSGLQKKVNSGMSNMKNSYNAGNNGMSQSGGVNVMNRLGGVRRALSGR